MSHLFDDRPLMDPDYRAAVEFCRSLFPNAPDELLPGYSSANFCPIAHTLAVACGGTDFPDKLTTDEMERIGGLSTLFEVDLTRVVYPAFDEWAIDLVNDEDTDEIEELLASGEYDYDSSGSEMLRRCVPMPTDVQRFIKRFDSGEFPSLHLEEPAR